MKKYILFICSVLIAISLTNCSNDDDSIPDPIVVSPEDTDDNVNLESQVIAGLTDSNSKVWKIETATLTNSSEDISDLFNIKDDEFKFSVGSSSSQLNLRWNKGFQVAPGETREAIKSDIQVSSETFQIQIQISEGITNISTPSNSFIGNYNREEQKIFGLLYSDLDEEPLSVTLIAKELEDYQVPATTLSNAQELFTYNTGIFRVGFKVSQSQNALFLTNKSDLSGFGSLQSFRYDLTNATLSTLEFTTMDFATKNIEFIGNQVASIGGGFFEMFSLDFTTIEDVLGIEQNDIVSNGTAALDNNVYLFGGVVNGGLDNITLWDTVANTFTDITSTPFELNDLDGEIIDQKLYMFGGRIVSSNSVQGSDKAYIYDIENNLFNQVTLPVFLKETYTSVVENLIYVGGLESIDVDNDGDFERIPYLGVFNTVDNSFQEITLDVENILSNRRLVHLQVAGGSAYFVTSENIGAPNGFVHRVYSANLD